MRWPRRVNEPTPETGGLNGEGVHQGLGSGVPLLNSERKTRGRDWKDMIRIVNENHIQAVTQFGEIVGEANRSGKGNLWHVYLTHHRQRGRTRNETPHVRVSGKLTEQVQRRLVIAALTTTTGVLSHIEGAG